MGADTDGIDWAWAKLEPEPDPGEKALRDQFVDEYLVDYDIVAAASRCGFQKAFAEEFAKRLWNEAYVQRRIKQAEQRPVDPEALEAYDRNRIRAALMREAHNPYTSGGARVAALSKLMSLYGMDAPTKAPDAATSHRGGVMMVPAIADPDAWERTAMPLQVKLSEDARSDIAG